ncbi:oxysterol-binding protein-related protein 10-like, partial [Anneissia japonica]|uniref:oxysterol-binding protein-related protein 10-like n=1 Tax=Anneissia japonica TaxID=1529436 RepID=UPI001425A5E3
RSILTVPWMELGGKVNIHCQQTGFHASVTFLTKPFYGGKVHRVTAEVKNNSGVVVCKASGEWNGLLEFTYATGEKKQIDTTRLSPTPKSVRPLEVQAPYESRKLWQHVTNSLKLGDLNTATEHKKQ